MIYLTRHYARRFYLAGLSMDLGGHFLIINDEGKLRAIGNIYAELQRLCGKALLQAPIRAAEYLIFNLLLLN